VVVAGHVGRGSSLAGMGRVLQSDLCRLEVGIGQSFVRGWFITVAE
jgi:hypothetical protein